MAEELEVEQQAVQNREADTDTTLPTGKDDGWIDEWDEMSHQEQNEHNGSVCPLKLVLAKVCHPYSIINSLTNFLPKWKDVLANLHLSKHIMPQDVCTEWNSTYMMLNSTLEYKAVICNMTSNIKYGLRKYELDWDEWAMVKDLLKVISDISLVLVSTTFIWTLQVFKHATDFFSCSGAPNLTLVIPVMHNIDHKLTTYATNPANSKALWVASMLAKKDPQPLLLINRSLQCLLDCHECIFSHPSLSSTLITTLHSLVLYPGYKLEYFKQMKWPRDCIQTAWNISKDCYKAHYIHLTVEEEPPWIHVDDKESMSEDEVCHIFLIPCQILKHMFSFNPLFQGSHALEEELDDYLASEIENVKDHILWWQCNWQVYPWLSRMALDYLKILVHATHHCCTNPAHCHITATLVDVECVFSHG